MVVWFLNFGGISIVFSIMAVPIYSSTSSVQETPFSTSLPAYIVFFIETILIVWDDVLLWFWFVYLWLMMLSICSCTIWKNGIFFGKMSVLVLYPFLNQVILFFVLLSSGMFLDINPLSNIWFANVFSQSIHCLFILLIVSFLCRALYFNVVLFWPKRSLFWCSHDTEKPKWTLCQPNTLFLYFFFFWPVHCQDQCQGAYSLCNLLGFFMISEFTLKSLICLF